MHFTAKTFVARFSAISNQWTVKTEEVEFAVTYLKIKGFDTGNQRLATMYQVVKASDVECRLSKNVLRILKSRRLKREHLWELFNPDKPRNLAKTVTVR